MSRLGNFLQAHLEQTGRTAYAVAADMGIGATHLSRFINGHNTSCNADTLAKMATGISDDPHIQAAFLRAYFQDQVLPEMRPWIQVEPETGGDGQAARLAEESPTYGQSSAVEQLRQLLLAQATPTDFVRNLQTIVKRHPHYAVLADLIHDLAELTQQVGGAEPPEDPAADYDPERSTSRRITYVPPRNKKRS
jgi:hypothetical protein